MSKRVLILISLMSMISDPAMARSATPKVSLQTISFIGEKTASLTGSYGYGVDFRTSRGDLFQFTMGGTLLYSSALSYLDEEDYSATLTSADMIVGFNLVPFSREKLRPYIGVYGLAGYKYLQLVSPPTGTSENSMGFSYGYMASIGFQLQTSSSRFWELSVDYISNTAPQLAGKEFQLSGLGMRVGLTF